MDQEKLEEIFNEEVWRLIESLKNRDLESYQAEEIFNGLGRLINRGGLKHFWNNFEIINRDPELKELMGLKYFELAFSQM